MSCGAGFISIVDTFLLPDGSGWTGSITYTLLYATTAAGATLIQARQNINVSAGINICLAPGLYDVVYNQSGQDYPVSSQWNVPATGGPLTVAAISAGVFPPVSAAGSNTQIQFNDSGLFGASSGLTWNKLLSTLTASGATAAGGGSLIGASSSAQVPVAGDMLYVGTVDATGANLRAITAVAECAPIAAMSGSANSFRGLATCPATSAANFTSVSNGGGIVCARFLSSFNGTGTANLISAVRASAFGSGIMTAVHGVDISVTTTGSIGTAAAVFINSSSGTITTNYGVFVSALSVGATRFAFYAVSDPSYFGGGIQSPLTTPASSAATGTAGQIEWDAGFVYVCTATNTWKRAALVAF